MTWINSHLHIKRESLMSFKCRQKTKTLVSLCVYVWANWKRETMNDEQESDAIYLKQKQRKSDGHPIT